MKKIYVLVVVLSVLLVSAVAFAGPWGLRSADQSYSENEQKFFNETKSLRKELHNKRFELMELYRTPDADKSKIDLLEKEIAEGRKTIQEKAAELNIGPEYGNCRVQQDQGRYNRPDCFREGRTAARECWKDRTYSRRGMGLEE